MPEVDAPVHHRYDHLRGSGGHLPGPEQIDVRSGHGVGQGAVVVVVPLQASPGSSNGAAAAREAGERRNGCAGETDRAGRLTGSTCSTPGSCEKVAGRPCHRRHRVEPDIVPAVKSFTARALSSVPQAGIRACMRVTPRPAAARSNFASPVRMPLRVSATAAASPP